MVKKTYAFLYGTINDAMDMMMRGEALRMLKSYDKNRTTGTHEINIDNFNKTLTSVGKQLIKFDAIRDSSMKPSEQKIADLAYSFYAWNPEEINRLNSFFRTRNIIKSKELRKIVLKIGDAVRNNQTHDKYFTALKNMLPPDEEKAPRCTEIQPILNFLNKALWKS